MARKYRFIWICGMFLMVTLICMAWTVGARSWADEFPTITERDGHGVWFIHGKNGATTYDMFEAMGYAVATDRLWQAELYRRQARGRLAEIFGPGENGAHLNTDVFMRTIAYTEAELQEGFDALAPTTRDMVSGYVDGFNRRIGDIEKDPRLVPFEFNALQFMPERWRVTDVLAWHATIQRNFDPEALDTGQLDNLRLMEHLKTIAADPDQLWAMFDDLRWTNDADAATYFDPQRRPCRRLHGAAGTPLEPAIVAETAARISNRRKEMFASLEKINARIRMGSYAWVVSGNHTQSGNPILYSGPQMGFSVPAIVVEGSLRGAGIDVSGMTIPGLPGIIVGRTPHHTWSMQVGHAHTTDYYFDSSVDAILSTRYETIKQAGGDDVTIPVNHTRYGPVISPLPLDPRTYAFHGGNPIVSWRYAHRGHEFEAMEGFLDMALADSMDAFGDAIEKVAVSQHFCYADREGNIAYWMSGRDPERYAGEWRLPQGSLPGIPPEDWVKDDMSGEYFLLDRSTHRNAHKGYYAGWNNKSQPDYDNAYNSIKDIYGPFQRSHVIYEYFDRRIAKRHGKKFTFEEIRDLALDIAATDSLGLGGNPWTSVAPHFKWAVWKATWKRGSWQRKIARWRALRLLRRWDGHFVAGGASDWALGTDRADAWMLMDTWVHEVLRLTFADELGPYLSGPDAPSGVMAAKQWPNGELRVLINVLLHGLMGHGDIVNEYNWFKNMGDGPSGRNRIIVAALDNALDFLGTRPWGTGQRGEITYTHPILGEVWRTPFASRSTYAQVVEMGPGGPVRIESMFPLGQSGHIGPGPTDFDPHFFSMTNSFDLFAPREFPLFDE